MRCSAAPGWGWAARCWPSLLRPLGTLPALVLAAAGCLVALAADLRLAGFHLPLHPRQVNELWLMRYRRWLYAAGFGVQIGVGFATYIMTAATYLVVLLAGLTGSPALALSAGLLFGLVRGMAVLLSSRCRGATALQRLHARLSALEPASLRTVIASRVGRGDSARNGGRRHRRAGGGGGRDRHAAGRPLAGLARRADGCRVVGRSLVGRMKVDGYCEPADNSVRIDGRRATAPGGRHARLALHA